MTEKMTLSVDELAQELGISKPLAYNLIKRNDFPSLRISERRIVIPVDALRSWLNANAGLIGG
ncbi:MAG: helix-turn-helix domain-containing protein [Clostridia bacterium]|nr:helix-turn-helix domain-containing protein [Clostridia bacterium]